MATKNGKLVAEFSFRNSTKRKWRFEETSQTGVDTIYIPQSAFKTQPKKVRVTVEVIA
jgi:hypothetical protein